MTPTKPDVQRRHGTLRHPDAESHDYPGLCVHDGRVTGSITVGCTRLPLWAFIAPVVWGGWDEAKGWNPERYGFTASDLGTFLNCLLNNRGEFGRLVCLLAEVERRGRGYPAPAWYETKTNRRRVLRQLQRCIAVLEAYEE